MIAIGYPLLCRKSCEYQWFCARYHAHSSASSFSDVWGHERGGGWGMHTYQLHHVFVYDGVLRHVGVFVQSINIHSTYICFAC